MIFSYRQKLILTNCLKSKEAVTVAEMMNLLDTSRRTLFRELKTLNEQLIPFHLELVNIRKKGLSLKGEQEDLDHLASYLDQKDIPYFNKEERQSLLAFKLLTEPASEKLLYYADLFQVSEATISKDLDAITPLFEKDKIQIVRKAGSGISLKADEKNIRRAISSLIHSSLPTQSKQVDFLNSKSLLENVFLSEDESIIHLLNRDILVKVVEVFQEYQSELGFDTYAQSSYIGMIIHLVIAIDRIQKNEAVEQDVELPDSVYTNNSYEVAKSLCHILEKEFDIEIPESEICLVTLHIMGAKSAFKQEWKDYPVDTDEVSTIIDHMIDLFEEPIRTILYNDKDFIHGLQTHLEPTIIRLKNHMPIYNPLLNQIEENYSDLYKKTKVVCEYIENRLDLDMDENEIGFITIHVGAALERNESQRPKRTIHVGVVCASGIGVSALLTARIRKYVSSNIVLHTLSLDDVFHKRFKESELLVSTFSLEMETDLPTIQVDSLLSQQDVVRIKNQLQRIEKLPPNKSKSNQEESFIQRMQKQQEQASYCLQVYNSLELLEVKQSSTISDLIECIPNQEIQKALKAREAKGSAIFEDEGFAMLHASGNGIKDPKVYFLYPNTEKFQSEQLNHIEFVIVLLMEDDQEIHREVFSEISRSLIEKESFVQAIKTRDKYKILEEFDQILSLLLSQS